MPERLNGGAWASFVQGFVSGLYSLYSDVIQTTYCPCAERDTLCAECRGYYYATEVVTN